MLKKKQFAAAVENLLPLLIRSCKCLFREQDTQVDIFNPTEPGGYLQWDEFDYAKLQGYPFGPVHAELIDLTSRCFDTTGSSIRISEDLEEAFKAAGLEDVVREERNSYWNGELASLTRKWVRISFEGAVARSLQWEGRARDFETAKELMRPMLGKLDREYAGGVVPNCAFRIVLGLKPL